jgi:hypothetical protein
VGAPPATEALKLATALFSIVKAKLRIFFFPSEGDVLQVKEVSLNHRVATQELSQMRARGFEFVFEK